MSCQQPYYSWQRPAPSLTTIPMVLVAGWLQYHTPLPMITANCTHTRQSGSPDCAVCGQPVGVRPPPWSPPPAPEKTALTVAPTVPPQEALMREWCANHAQLRTLPHIWDEPLQRLPQSLSTLLLEILVLFAAPLQALPHFVGFVAGGVGVHNSLACRHMDCKTGYGCHSSHRAVQTWGAEPVAVTLVLPEPRRQHLPHYTCTNDPTPGMHMTRFERKRHLRAVKQHAWSHSLFPSIGTTASHVSHAPICRHTYVSPAVKP
jgi:hypothetical protein